MPGCREARSSPLWTTDGPLRRVHFPRLLFSCQFFFEGLDEIEKVQFQLRRGTRFKEQPVPTLWVFRDQVGRVYLPRQPLRIGFHRAYEVEAEQGEVGEVVPAERLTVQVGVDQAQSLEAC